VVGSIRSNYIVCMCGNVIINPLFCTIKYYFNSLYIYVQWSTIQPWKEWYPMVYNKMDRTRGRYVKWNNSDTDRQILHIFSHLHILSQLFLLWMSLASSLVNSNDSSPFQKLARTAPVYSDLSWFFILSQVYGIHQILPWTMSSFFSHLKYCNLAGKVHNFLRW
jgi:hypothetical protein